MNRIFNTYEDRQCAEGYAQLEFPGCYHLAYRDLPELIATHVQGGRALDFGCGAGRSTRFLTRLGLTTVGADISQNMLAKAREIDPCGDYRLLGDSGLHIFPDSSFNLILSAFTFDNIPGEDKKIALFTEFRRLISDNGVIINLVSQPDIYRHEWASFSTKDFPENLLARDGDVVRIINTDSLYRLPVEDILWSEPAYQATYKKAGLKRTRTHKPLGKPDDGFQWIIETTIPPWRLDILENNVPET